MIQIEQFQTKNKAEAFKLVKLPGLLIKFNYPLKTKKWFRCTITLIFIKRLRWFSVLHVVAWKFCRLFLQNLAYPFRDPFVAS